MKFPKFNLFVLCFLWVIILGCKETEYILPTPDGDKAKASPPHVVGRIVEIKGSIISLRTDQSALTQVGINLKTSLFTSYGGFVRPEELKSGLLVRIWFVTSNPKQAGNPPIAAVIETLPSDDKSPIYLIKANNDLISHCKCEHAIAVTPAQLDCPWCGCGWLFVCSVCRKGFTFAKAVQAEEMPTGFADIEPQFNSLEIGKTYVYLDGTFISTEADGVHFKGIHSSHDLSVVPQVEALKDPSIIKDLLRNSSYWVQNKIQND
jgi:hypothetical protein